MRPRALFTLVVGIAVLLTACGSGGDGKKATPRASASTSLSTAQLQTRLLSATDVGSGWRVGEPINAEDLASVPQTIPCGAGTVDATLAKRLTAVTGTQFEPTDRSYKHLIELVLTGEPAQLDSDLKALIGAMDSCATSPSPAADGSTATVKRLTIPDLGDQRVGYLLIGTESASSPATWYVRNAAVRTGSVAVVFGLTEILAAPTDKPQITDEAFVQLLRTAVGKLAA